MITTSTRERLKEIMRRAIMWGPVVLSSGELSDHYFDGKIVTLDAEGSFFVAKMILDMIKSDIESGAINSIGGLTLGADPIIASTVTLSYIEKCPINGFIVRKEQKRHGKQKWIEGVINSGDKVIIIDDVTTKGNSVMKAIERVKEAGAEVVKIISIVDRLEGARDLFERAGYNFNPIFTKDELLDKECVEIL